MTKRIINLAAGAASILFVTSSASGATSIIADNYDVANVGSGFLLGEGLNSGINPPTTRLTGSAAGGIRYLNATPTQKNATAYSINNNRMRITSGAQSGRATLSADGAAAFDFGPALGTAYATPANPAEYDITISMDNNATGTQRFSFAIGTVEGSAGAWDFGLQLHRGTAGDTFYTVTKRIDTGSSGLGSDVNEAMFTMAAGTVNTEIDFLIRVTDAGAESSTFSSRVQVSTDGGATWLYDTSADATLLNGFRFDGSGRYFSWDIAANDSAVTYDNFSVTWLSGPSAPGTFVWNGAGANDNWSTAGNWVGSVAPSGFANLVFNGATRPASINDIAGLTIPDLTFNNGGFTLFAVTPIVVMEAITNLAGINTFAGDLNWTTTGPKSWSIASASEIVLDNINNVEVNGNHVLSGGGTLRLKGTMNIGQSTTANPPIIVNEGQFVVDGGSLSSRGGFRIGTVEETAAGAQTVLTNNAMVTFSQAGSNLRVGDVTNALSKLIIEGSTLNMSGGVLGVPYAAGATGEVSQVGGSVSGMLLSFNEAGAGRGIYTVKNGTLGAFQIRDNVSTGGSSTIYFDNARLQPLSGATNAFMSGLNRAEILAGGLTLEALADVTIGQNITGAGSLTNEGSYTVTLTGNNTYTGNTYVKSGKLVLGTGRNYGTVQVADYAAFGVLARVQDATLTNATLALGTGVSMSFDLSTFSNPTNAMLQAPSLSASGPVTIELKKALLLGLYEGVIPLVDYDGTIGGGAANFVGSVPVLPNGVNGYLVDNTTDTRIDLVITGVPGYRWTGAQSDVWDHWTENWLDLQTGLASAFYDGYPTEFRDGANTGNVIIDASFPTPSAIIISNAALPYVFDGNPIGNLSIVPLIKKYGSGSFTRIGGLISDSIAGVELNEGSLIVSNETFTTPLTDVGTGTGVLVKRGDGELLLNSTNASYDGSVRIEEGSIKLGHSDSLGRDNGEVTIMNGTTLDLNDHQPGAKPIVVSGDGTAGQGAIIDSTTGGAVETNLRDVTLAGNTSFGSSGRWDLRIRDSTGPGPGLKGNGYNLSKVGSGHVSIASQRNITEGNVYWEMNLGDVFVKEGQLTFAENLTPGNPGKIVSVFEGATLSTYNLNVTNPFMRNLYITNAAILFGGNNVDFTNVFTGTVEVTGSAWLRFEGASRALINGSIVGSGAVNVAVNGSGAMLQLNAANTYPGATTVTNCMLAGGGSIAGNLEVQSAATLAPGNPVGVFTVGGSATVAGTTIMELNRNLAPNSDRLVVGGAVNITGPLQIVLAANPQGGDVYQLFNKAVSIPPANITLPDISALPGSMTWDITQIGVDGTLRVNGTAQPPVIGTVSQGGGIFTFTGTGGTEGGTYYVVTSPDVTAPMGTWTPVATNTFGPGGIFSFSTNIVGGAPEAFFRVKLP